MKLLTLRGNFLLGSSQDRKQLVLDAYKEMADSLREVVMLEFERSVELGSYVGTMTDPEALRTILRSVKVEITGGWPPDLKILFADDFAHWYGGDGELPKELSDVIEKVFNLSTAKWSIAKYPDIAFRNMMGS